MESSSSSSSLSSLQSLVAQVKKELFSSADHQDNINVYNFVTPSAYETAWLSMIPHDAHTQKPMFKSCLEWVLNNQKEGGFWGELNHDGFPTIDTLPATLACLVALKTWNVGEQHIIKGTNVISTHN